MVKGNKDYHFSSYYKNDLQVYEYVYDALFYNSKNNKHKNVGAWAELFAKDDRFQRWYQLFPNWNTVKTYKRSLWQVGEAMNDGFTFDYDKEWEKEKRTSRHANHTELYLNRL